MHDSKDNPTARLDALVGRLTPELEPPADLWAAIAVRLDAPGAALDAPGAALDSMIARLPSELEPPADLWPKIEAQLAPTRQPAGTARAAAAVGITAVAVIAALFAFGAGQLASRTASMAAAPAASWLDVFWPVGTGAIQTPDATLRLTAAALAEEVEAVRRERLAIEAALAAGAESTRLHALWFHLYETELRLTDQVGRLLQSHQRGS
jgi:hypothetical protein